jgi:hypothetical protein
MKSIELTFCDTACVPGVLKIAEVIQKLKHTHTNVHMHMSYAACKLFKTYKVGWYDGNEIRY